MILKALRRLQKSLGQILASQKRHRSARRLFFEPLENRRVLTCDVTPILASVDEGSTEGIEVYSYDCLDSQDAPVGVTVYYSITGTSTPGTDHTLPASGSWHIPSGGLYTGSFSALADSLTEGTETLVLTITNAVADDQSVSVHWNSSAVTYYIYDVAGVTISKSGSPSEQGLATGTFTVTRSGATTQSLTVYVGLSGTASAGDYSSSGSWSIPAGQSSTTVTITPTQDCTYESGGETVIATIQPHAGYNVATPSTETLTIADNDSAPTISITDQSVSESAGTASFPVSLSCAK